MPKGEYFEDHDDENYRLWVWWKYELRNKVWDEDTNTWTITNKFVKKTEIIGRIWYHTPETYINISKKAVGLTNTNKKATTDSLLNALRRGDTAEISYDVSGVGRFLDYTYGDGYDSIHLIENEQYDYAGQRPARFEVIDEHLYFYDSEKESGIKELDLDPEDYCISKFVPELPTLLTYIQSDKYLPWEWTANEELSRQAEIFLLGRSINSDGEFGEWVTYASFKNGSLTAMNGASVLGDALILRLSAPVQLRGDTASLLEIAEADGPWIPARAEVCGAQLLLRADDVRQPLHARYAWTDYAAEVPFFGENGLPLEPFDL